MPASKSPAVPGQRRLEYLPLRQIMSAPRNPNGHDLPAIAASIRRHGFVEPVVVDERTGFLVGGHGRLEVLAEMRDAGEQPPEGIVEQERAENDVAAEPEWLAPTILGWASRSDAEAEALLLAMMKLPKTAVASMDLLATMLDELSQGTELALAGTGYSPDDLDDILAGLSESAPLTELEYGDSRKSAYPEPSYGERTDNYRNKQVRAMVFDYPLDDYALVAEMAARARGAFGVQSNAELFQRMLEAWCMQNPETPA
jgi:hypothetical protein